MNTSEASDSFDSSGSFVSDGEDVFCVFTTGFSSSSDDDSSTEEQRESGRLSEAEHDEVLSKADVTGCLYPRIFVQEVEKINEAFVSIIHEVAKWREAWVFMGFIKNLLDGSSVSNDLICDVVLVSQTNPIMILSCMENQEKKKSLMKYNSSITKSIKDAVKSEGWPHFQVINGLIDISTCGSLDSFKDRILVIEQDVRKVSVVGSLEMNSQLYQDFVDVFLEQTGHCRTSTEDDKGAEYH